MGVVAAGLAAACAKATPTPTVAPEPEAVSIERDAYTQSIGALSDYDVNEAFKELYPLVEKCLERSTERFEGLGGSFTIALRIRPDGSVKWAYLKSSTLGDREAERCVLRAAKRRSWPKPVGGEGEADHTFSAESPAEVVQWDEGRLRTVMTSIQSAVHGCTQQVEGAYHATLYIGRSGDVVSAGVAPPSPEGEASADCVVEQLRGFRFGQQPKLTKVSFVLP